MDIGFVGLGQMGVGIAGNFLKAGHRLTVWNRSADKAEPLVAAGARLAATPADAASGDIVFTMLADDKAVEAVAFGKDGLLEGRATHIGLSTISVDLARRLARAHAEAGGTYVSAPVFGRPPVAEAGQLFVVAAGPAAAIEAAKPAFEAFSRQLFVAGDTPERANVVKLSGNFMILATVEMLAEAMTLAARQGVDPGDLLEIVTGTLFGSPIVRTYGEILRTENFRPAGFTAPLGLKDMDLVAAAARERHVPMPLLSLLRDRLVETIATQGPDIDWSGIARVVDASAGPRPDPQS